MTHQRKDTSLTGWDRRHHDRGAPAGTAERRKQRVFTPTISAGAMIQAFTVLGAAVTMTLQTSGALQAIRDDFRRNWVEVAAQQQGLVSLLNQISQEQQIILNSLGMSKR